jgi:hypothetical protein
MILPAKIVPDEIRPSGMPHGFIGGFRSGSTLLINLLGLHSRVTAWYETKFLAEALRWIRVLRDPAALEMEAGLVSPAQLPGFGLAPVTARMRWHIEASDAQMQGGAPSGKRSHERYPLGADRIHYGLADAMKGLDRWHRNLAGETDPVSVARSTADLFRELAERHLAAEPSPVLINKTPELPRFGVELRECFGPHKIILLIRDGRSVVRSATALNWGDPARIAHLWRELIIQSRDAAREAPRDYLEVRYEDLVTRPVAVLDDVCAFLGLSFEGEQMTRAYQDKAGIPIGSHAAASPVTCDAAADMTVRVAGDLLAELGYLDHSD